MASSTQGAQNVQKRSRYRRAPGSHQENGSVRAFHRRPSQSLVETLRRSWPSESTWAYCGQSEPSRRFFTNTNVQPITQVAYCWLSRIVRAFLKFLRISCRRPGRRSMGLLRESLTPLRDRRRRGRARGRLSRRSRASFTTRRAMTRGANNG